MPSIVFSLMVRQETVSAVKEARLIRAAPGIYVPALIANMVHQGQGKEVAIPIQIVEPQNYEAFKAQRQIILDQINLHFDTFEKNYEQSISKPVQAGEPAKQAGKGPSPAVAHPPKAQQPAGLPPGPPAKPSDTK